MSSKPEPSQPTSQDAPPLSSFVRTEEALVKGRQLLPPPRPGTIGLLDHFDVLRVLGEGGMGIVLLARDTKSGQLAAVKLLKNDYAARPGVVTRFLTEARRLRKLKHPHLVPVLEIVDRPEGPYFVMPYFKRGSLASFLQQDPPLEATRMREISEQIADALRFVHSKGLTHRDIKPGNILLAEDGAACLADFGLARTMFNDPVIDVEGDQCEGTAPYMSPAVAAGEAEDTRCDIYAFGALMYEMLVGRSPYEGRNTGEVRKKILAGPPKPIRDLNSSADRKLADIAEAALAREHRDRYASMADILLDLGRVRGGLGPVGPHGRLRSASHFLKAVKRAPKAVRLAVLGTLAASILILFWPHPHLKAIRRIAAPQVSSWEQAIPVQWQGLPSKDLIVAEETSHCLFVYSLQGNLVGKWLCPDAGASAMQVNMVADVDGDGLEEAFVSWRKDALLSVAVVNQYAHELKRFSATGSAPNSRAPSGPSELLARGFVKPKGTLSGHSVVLAALTTGYGNKPRGLCCFDYKTGQLVWQSPTAPPPTWVQAVDLAGDGVTSLICGSYACANGNTEADGTDDSHAYVFAFTLDGHELWHTEVGDAFADVGAPLVVSAQGHKSAIIVPVIRHLQKRTSRGGKFDRLVKLDDHGVVVASRNFDSSIISSVAADLNGDGSRLIYCTDAEGFLYSVDATLKVRSKSQFGHRGSEGLGEWGRADFRVVSAAKLLTGKARQLVICGGYMHQDTNSNPGYVEQPPQKLFWDGLRVTVLGANLNEIAHTQIADQASQSDSWTVQTAALEADGLDEILCCTRDSVAVLKLVK